VVEKSGELVSSVTVVTIEHKTKDEGLFLASFNTKSRPPRDIWLIHNLVHKDFIEALGPDGKTFDEVERVDGKCAGQDAAIVRGTLRVKGTPGRVWFCTFLYNDHAYRLMYALADKHAPDEEQLRAMVDATELTSP
jgi:hypothetical protein